MESMTYRKVGMDSFGTESNDCTVKVLAITTGTPYAEAHAVLKAKGRSNGKGCNQLIWKPAFTKLGFQLVKEEVSAPTLKSILPQLENNKNYLIIVKGHVLAVVNGKIEDWSAGRKFKVQKVYQVLPIGQPKSQVPADIILKRVKVAQKAPREGTIGAKIWAYLDDNYGHRDNLNKDMKRQIVEELHYYEGFNFNNGKTELSLWVKFHNILDW